jgi:hypothetical protein
MLASSVKLQTLRQRKDPNESEGVAGGGGGEGGSAVQQAGPKRATAGTPKESRALPNADVC